jgi:hypothetical protein
LSIDDFIIDYNLQYHKTVVLSALEIIDFSLLLPMHRIETGNSMGQNMGLFDENISRLRGLEEACFAA